MADVTDKYEIEIDTAQAQQSIKELAKDNEELVKSMNDLIKAGKAGSEEYQKLASQWKNNQAEIDKLNEGIKENNKVLDEQADKGKKVGGIFSESVNAYNAAGGGIKGVTAAAKAFIATPLGAALTAIVGALGLFKKALSGSASGQRALAMATSVVKGVFDSLLQVVRDTGTLLVDFFTGNWSKLGEDVNNIGAAVKGIGTNMEENANIAAEELEIRKREKDLQEQVKKNEIDINKLRAEANKVNDPKKRQDLIKKANELEKKNIDDQIKLETDRLTLLQKKHSLTDSSIEDLEEESNVEQKIYDLEAKKYEIDKKDNKIIANTTKQIEKQQEETEKVVEKVKDYTNDIERLKNTLFSETDDRTDLKKLKDELKARQDLIDEFVKSGQLKDDEAKKMKEQAQAAYDKKELELKKKHNEELDKIAEEQKEKDLAIAQAREDAKSSIVHNSLGAISTLMESQNETAFNIGKAAAIADATVKTYEGATDAYMGAIKNPLLNTTPGLAQAAGIAAAAAVTAAGFANIAKIKSTQFKSASSKSSSVPTSTVSSSVSVPSTTTSKLTGVQSDLATMNLHTNTSDTSRQTPQTVLVVDEVTAKQDRQKFISNISTL